MVYGASGGLMHSARHPSTTGDTGMNGPLDDGTVVTVGADGTIEVAGDIDMAAGPLLESTILEREAATEHLVIDLANVHFIDSSGLRVLLGASRRTGQRGGSVVLRGAGVEVTRLLEITGTTEQFVVEPSR